MTWLKRLILVLALIGATAGTALVYTVPAGARVGRAAATEPVVFNVTDFGAIGDASPTNAAVNAAAFNKAISAAASSNPSGQVYVPMTKGFVLNNGVVKVPASNVVIRGDASMGSSDAGLTSTVIGQGPGSTITVAGSGCSVRGLVLRQLGGQAPGDASLMVTATQVTVDNLCIQGCNIGVSLQLPTNVDGEFWLSDILVGGNVGVAGIVANAGNAAVRINHAIMYAADPQPPYGICVTSCGELGILGLCDVINCGTCLGIVPGLNGVKGQHAVSVCVSDSLFDGGNGQGCVYICPQTDAYVLRAAFSNVWASTANNNSGVWGTNGFTFDGTQSKPASNLLKPIQDVSLVNCTGKGFVQHCGCYAKGVQALSITSSTFGGCFNGIQIAGGCTDYVLTGNRSGNYVPPPVGTPATGSGGNAAYGILIEPNDYGIVNGNMLRGNGLGGLLNQFPNPHQFVSGNLQ